MSTTRENKMKAERSRLASVKGERLDLRLPAELKELIEQAAALVGQNVSAFILGLAVPHAREVIRDAENITLSGQDRDRFLTALDDVNAEPNEALRRAAGKYKAAIG